MTLKTLSDQPGKTTMHWTNPESWSWLPFVLATGQRPPKMNVQRIIEALIIAGITAGLSMYVTVQVLGAEIKSMQKDMQRIEQSVNRINRDFYPPVIPPRH